jgi:hypothetical protein
MLKIILFICLLPFAMMEIFFYKQFGLVAVGFLYFVLQLQADRAAKNFLADGLKWKFPTRQSEAKRRQQQAEEEEISVAPLFNDRAETEFSGSQPGQPGFYTAMRKDPRPQEKPSEKARVKQPNPFNEKTAKTSPARNHAQELPRIPNFHGRAHEVLAISENAATRTIKRAFRFWVKKVHPDHNQLSHMANYQVQKITEAKELLLTRRRAKKSAA